jgi:K+-sensing histidine kinase KdpD
VGYLAALLGIAAVIAVCELFHDQLSNTTVALVLVLVVLCMAAPWGRGPGIVASVLAMLGFNGLFKNVLEWRTQMPVQGLRRSPLLALGAMVLEQLVLLYQHEHHLPLGKGIKPLVRAA